MTNQTGQVGRLALAGALAACLSCGQLKISGLAGGDADATSPTAGSSGQSPTVGGGGPLSEKAERALQIAEYNQVVCDNGEIKLPGSCKRGVESTREKYAALTAAERAHPKLAAAMRVLDGYYDKSLAMIAAGEANEAAEGEQYELSELFKKFVRGEGGRGGYETTLTVLLKGKKKQPGSFTVTGSGTLQSADSLKEWSEERKESIEGAIADFGKNCPAVLRVGIYEQDKGTAADPAVVCDLIKNRKTYFRAFLEASVRDLADTELKAYQSSIAGLKSTGRIDEATYDKLKSGSKLGKDITESPSRLAKAVGIELPKQLKAEIRELEGSFQATLSERARKRVWNGKARYKDANAKRALSRNATEHGLTVKLAGTYTAGWDVVKNERGIPLERTKDASILAKKRGESFCRTYDIRVVEEHEGGGRYGATKVYSVGFERFYVTKC